MRSFQFLIALGLPLLLLLRADPVGAQQPDSSATPAKATSSSQTKEAPYVPTPQHVVLRMLEAADVGEGDVVYDLGSGDGRIVITAAQEFGAKGVGIEIDPELVKLARRKAEQAGVADQVEFRQEDLFEADISKATVVTLYLWPTMNNRLRPKLQEELTSGTRILSHNFDIDGWSSHTDTTFTIGSQTLQHGRNKVFLWTLPVQ